MNERTDTQKALLEECQMEIEKTVEALETVLTYHPSKDSIPLGPELDGLKSLLARLKKGTPDA